MNGRRFLKSDLTPDDRAPRGTRVVGRILVFGKSDWQQLNWPQKHAHQARIHHHYMKLRSTSRSTFIEKDIHPRGRGTGWKSVIFAVGGAQGQNLAQWSNVLKEVDFGGEQLLLLMTED